MTQLESLLTQLQEHQFSSPERVIALATDTVELARLQSDGRALIRALTSLSYAEQVQGQFQEAFEHIMEALGTSRGIRDTELRLTGLLRMASLLSDLDADHVALLVLASVERGWREGMDKAILMRAYVSMATSYLRQEKPEPALSMLGLALNIASELGDERTMYWCIHSIGIAHGKRGEYEAAIEKYRSVLPYYKNGGQLYNQTAVEMLLGAAYTHVDRSQAKYHLELAYQGAVEHQFELLAAESSIKLAAYYRLEGDIDEASRILHDSLSHINPEQESKAKRLLFAALSSFYEELGEYKLAFAYLKRTGLPEANLA